MLDLRRLLPTVIVVVGIFLISLGTVAAQDDPLTFVMVSHGGPEIEFWRPVIQGMEDACALLEAECHWLSNSFFSFEEMEGYWDEALALNPDGIATSAVAPEFVRAGVERAAELGIPVTTFNIDDPGAGTGEAMPTLLYVGADEFEAGVSNARRVLAEAEADGVTIARGVCANPFPEIAAVDARCAGAESVFAEAGIPLDRLTIDGNPSQAPRMYAAYFADHPETNAVFTVGPGEAIGLYDYILGADLQPRQLYATTHDVVPEILDMIRDGYLLQTVGQQPYMQGFQTIMSLYLASEFGLRPSGNIYTNVVVDQSNVDQAGDA